MSKPAAKPAAAAAKPAPAAAKPAPAAVHTTVTATSVDVDPHDVTTVFHAIWNSDKAIIKPFHEKKFPKAGEYHGNFVVKVCDAPKDRNAAKVHNLFKVYKWNVEKKTYEKTTNAELHKDPIYKSYKLVYVLFDNYESDETKPEVNTSTEDKEVSEFLNYVVDTEPMKVAAAYLRKKFANSQAVDFDDKQSFGNRAKFLAKLKKIWFDQYDWGKMKSLSGFEHTFVGERRTTGEVMGYHFWYKYWTDDSSENATGQDTIDFKARLDDASSDEYIAVRFAEYVDTDGDGVVDGNGDAQLFKSCGSFFVGCSAECKMALGTIAYYESKAAWAERRSSKGAQDRGDDEEGVLVQINGHKYKLSMHRGGDKHQYCRSFFPEKI